MVTRGKDRKVRKGGFKKARKGREQGRREGEVGEPGKEVNLWAAPKAHSLLATAESSAGSEREKCD